MACQFLGSGIRTQPASSTGCAQPRCEYVRYCFAEGPFASSRWRQKVPLFCPLSARLHAVALHARARSSVEHSIFKKSTLLDRIPWFVVGYGFFLSSSSQTSAPRGAKSASTRCTTAAVGSLGPRPSTCPAAPKVRECVRKDSRNSLSSPEVGKRAKGDAGAVERARPLTAVIA